MSQLYEVCEATSGFLAILRKTPTLRRQAANGSLADMRSLPR
jgi:hypothetical protein